MVMGGFLRGDGWVLAWVYDIRLISDLYPIDIRFISDLCPIHGRSMCNGSYECGDGMSDPGSIYAP